MTERWVDSSLAMQTSRPIAPPVFSPWLAVGATVLIAVGCEAGQGVAKELQVPDARSSRADAADAARADAGGIPEADGSRPDVRDPGHLSDAHPLDDGEIPFGPWTEIRLHNGETRTGELIAVYDHNYWWEQSTGFTYALFDAAQFAQSHLTDHSVAFVSSSQVAGLRYTPAPPGRGSHRRWMRERGLFLRRVPLDGRVNVIAGNGGYHREENGYGDFAWDLVRTDDEGRRFRDDGERNEDYLVWNDEVYLPAPGVVVELVRDVPDNEPGHYEPGAPNNLLGIHLTGAWYLYLLHFRQDSIPLEIEIGDPVGRDLYVGRVGNAGVSLEPHLHMSVLWYDAQAQRSWSVPAEFFDITVASSPRGPAARAEWVVPVAGSWIANEPFGHR